MIIPAHLELNNSRCDVHSVLHFCKHMHVGPISVKVFVFFPGWFIKFMYDHVFFSCCDSSRSFVPYKFQVTAIELCLHLRSFLSPLTSRRWWGWWRPCSSFCFWPWPPGPRALISLWKVRVSWYRSRSYELHQY